MYAGDLIDGSQALYGDVLYGEDIPREVDAVNDRPAWEYEDGDTYEVEGASGTVLVSVGVDPTAPFALEVRTGSGGFKKRLQTWFGGQFEQVLSAGNKLEFSIPYSDQANVAPPNYIWLRDRRNHVVDRFKIRPRRVGL